MREPDEQSGPGTAVSDALRHDYEQPSDYLRRREPLGQTLQTRQTGSGGMVWISLVYGVHRQDELLQFTLNKQIIVEEVFGLSPDQDEDVTTFACCDLKRGMVRDTLDVKVLEGDGGKQYYGCRLSPEESSLLLTAIYNEPRISE